jgi:hypothetical protein
MLSRGRCEGAGREAFAVLRIPVDQRTVALFRLDYRLPDDIMAGGERTNGIGGSGVGGQQEGLAAAATEVDGLPGAASARLLHPAIAAEGVKSLRFGPDRRERLVADAVEV